MAGMIPLNRLGVLILLISPVLFFDQNALEAKEPIERELLHKQAVFVLEIQEPLAWADHPVLERVWKPLSKSRQLKAGLVTPEFGRVLAARDYLQAAIGQDWQQAIAELTAGGVWVAATPKPNERLTIVVTAKNADSWKRLEAAATLTLKAQNRDLPPSTIYREIKTYRAAGADLAFAGRRLLIASQESDLKRMIDQLLEHAEPEKIETGGTQSAQPSLNLAIDLKAVRRAPDFQKALVRPSDDAGQIAILGGWMDLLKAADRLRFKLSWPAGSEEIQATLTADDAAANEVLAGFFAGGPDRKIAPLLEPAGTIYTASWFRDYAALWNSRADLLTESALEKLEEGDQKIKQQFSVFGVSFTPSELFKQLGTEFRVVLVRSGDSEYRVELKNRLPAAAVCISLRDRDAFLAQAEPLSRALGLVAAFGEAKMLSKTSEHAEAKLKGLWFRDDENAVRQGNQIRYNFNPTWTVAREHFILGSTRKIVAQVIDELDRHSAGLKTAANVLQPTERQRLSFSELACGLMDFREAILQSSVLERGLTYSDSIIELDLAKDAIEALGRLTTEAAFTEQGLEYQIRLDPERARQNDMPK